MKARIKTIGLYSGSQIAAANGLTVVVGPNNVGKSVLLNSLMQRMCNSGPMGPTPGQIVSEVESEIPPREELEARLVAAGCKREPGQYPQGSFFESHYLVPQNQVMTTSAIDDLYRGAGSAGRFAQLGSFLAVLLQPENRLGQLGATATPNLRVDRPVSPMQGLFASRDMEAKLQAYAKRAFSLDVTVNRHSGGQITLHVGRPAADEPLIGDSTDYQDQLFALPTADQQGHGVQAFLGILMTLLSNSYDIVLVDEPEAFLHPPQARLLGSIFSELAKDGSQIIVSTHSDDFIQGVLSGSGADSDVSIARLTRPDATINSVAQVDPDRVRKLFEDPLLRYSKIMSGIFYAGVVICEAESDCRYYQAVLDFSFSSTIDQPKPDLMFAHCGGKDRLLKAGDALRATSVPTAIIADIDILAEEAKFKHLFNGLGGDFEEIATSYRVLHEAVRTRGVAANRVEARDRISELLDKAGTPELTSEESAQIRNMVTHVSGWKYLKTAGRTGIPSGDATVAFDQVVQASEKLGLFILTIGELERFHPEIPSGNKAAWLRDVFEKRLYEESPGARKLLTSVASYVQGEQGVPAADMLAVSPSASA